MALEEKMEDGALEMLLVIIVSIYHYTFRYIFVQNDTFSRLFCKSLILQITFKFIPFKPITFKFIPFKPMSLSLLFLQSLLYYFFFTKKAIIFFGHDMHYKIFNPLCYYFHFGLLFDF